MQQCRDCGKEVTPDMLFCGSCQEYAGSAGQGKKAGPLVRWVALVIDSAIWVIPAFLVSAISKNLGFVFAIAYFIWFLMLLKRGLTPGKMLLGLQVVDQRTGEAPGLPRMLLREIVGKFLSGLLFGLGYLWALFDKNAQTWHDKLAGTVVVKRMAHAIPARAHA